MANKNDECPYSSVNILSKATVWWMNPYFKKGYKQKLVSSDLYEIADEDQSVNVTNHLSKCWQEECQKAKRKGKRPSFKKAYWKAFMWPFMLNGFVVILTEVLRAVGPLFIGELSNYFVNPDTTSQSYSYMCAFGLAFSSLLYIFVDTLLLINLRVIGWNARSAVVGLMYEKTLKLNNEALAKTTLGKIVNLSATDAIRYDLGFMVGHYLWVAPLECAILAYVLYLQLGPAALIGMLSLVIIMGIQILIGKAFGKLRYKIATATDERVHAANEVIAGMRVVKMYSWEKPFQDFINSLRKREMRHVLSTSFFRSFNYTSNHSTNLLLSFVTFLSFIALQGDLNLQTVVVSLGFFTVLLLGAGLVFPWAVQHFFETLTALERTEEFLLLPEVAPSSVDSLDKLGVELVDFSASWTKHSKPTLQNISIEVKEGELLMLVGPVGCGKSSLLSAILGELPALSGQIHVGGKIAYTGQIPWLFSDTIRNNILFGEEFDLVRYRKVMKACDLDKDVSILPRGDLSLVGERGITLSGGQKARVSLARLAYRSDFNIAVMDDPLCAVDQAVANHLFDKCICGLLRKKVRILVTHQLQFLEKADRIVILKEGRIADHGTYKDLLRRGTDFASLIKVVKEDGSVCDDHHPTDSNGYLHRSVSNTDSHIHEMDNAEKTHHDSTELEMDHSALIKEPNQHQMYEENKEEEKEEDTIDPRSISLQVYKDYLTANLHFVFIIVLIILVIGSHALFILSDWWLARWALASQNHGEMMKLNHSIISRSASGNTTADPLWNSTVSTVDSVIVEPFDHHYYLYIYAGLTISFFVSMYARTAMHYYVCVQSSVNLHAKMLAAVLKAKIRFFDTNPIGAILNRFSKDMNQVDERLPTVFLDVLFNGAVVLSIVAFVISINYFIIIIVIPLSIYLIWIRRYFVATSREIKRIEGQDRSPVFSHLSSSLQGLVTIRTFRVQEAFINIYHRLQDNHGVAWSAHFFGARWFACRLDMATAAFIGSCAFFSVLLVTVLPEDWPINAGNLGLTLTYSTSLLIWFQWGVRQSAEMENMMTSVERIHEYHNLPAETNPGNGGKSPPSDWPEKGSISISKLSYAYYNDGPLVLRDINLDIQPGEKIGIVGRTGAGKSSVVAALFRMSDESFGSIEIDGWEAKHVDLHKWRSVLTIIPQDPVLFGGSMRRNLDPFCSYTDSQLWSALEKVHMKTVVENLPLKLEAVLSESGSNLSVGQRQLVCLARAILRDNRILIIDEATANVDSRTDRLIQETIRSEFSHCTVLTIAHRLDTIIDSDRILVLGNGETIECDEPYILLQDGTGALSGLLQMTGNRESELRKAAETAYLRRHNENKNVVTGVSKRHIGVTNDVSGINDVTGVSKRHIEVTNDVSGINDVTGASERFINSTIDVIGRNVISANERFTNGTNDITNANQRRTSINGVSVGKSDDNVTIDFIRKPLREDDNKSEIEEFHESHHLL